MGVTQKLPRLAFLLCLGLQPGPSLAGSPPTDAFQPSQLGAPAGQQGDGFGRSLAWAGSTLVVGAPGDDERPGAVYLFDWHAGAGWALTEALRPPVPRAGDGYGWTVGASGSTIAVGAPGDDDGGTDRGAVYVYRHVGPRWILEARLQPDDAGTGDAFGYRVALDGDTLLASAVFQDAVEAAEGAHSAGARVVPDVGAVYVYRATHGRDGATWVQQQKLTRLPADGARMGFSLALEGSVVAIGSPGALYEPLMHFSRSGGRFVRSDETFSLPGIFTCVPEAAPGVGFAARFGRIADVLATPSGLLVLESCARKLHTSSWVSDLSADGRVSRPDGGPWVPSLLTRPLKDLARFPDGTLWSTAGGVLVHRKRPGAEPEGIVVGTFPCGSDCVNLQAIDGAEASDDLYAVDRCAVIRIRPDGAVSLLAGEPTGCGSAVDGIGASARFNGPTDLDVSGHTIFVADRTSVRSVDISTGATTTLAGHGTEGGYADGTGSEARFTLLGALAAGPAGLFVADVATMRFVGYDGAVRTLAGNPADNADPGGQPYWPVDGAGASARLRPGRVTVASDGAAWFSDGDVIRRVTVAGEVSSVAGSPGVLVPELSLVRAHGVEAAGAPLSRVPFSTVQQGGGANLSSAGTRVAVWVPTETGARYGTAVSVLPNVLVLGPANGCVMSSARRCADAPAGATTTGPVHPVRLLRHVGGRWREWASLDSPVRAAGTGFGSVIASSGSQVAVGAPASSWAPQIEEPSSSAAAGNVYVYDLADFDGDHDTLPDLWEVLFGLDPTSASGAAGPSGDPDGDGVPNAVEVSNGGHPKANAAFSLYFAEGAQSSLFTMRLGLTTPDTGPAAVAVRHHGAGAVPAPGRLLLPAHSMSSIAVEAAGPSGAEFSTIVESDRPVVAGRLMTWPTANPSDMHAERAVPAPSRTWYFAEGSTQGGFELFYLLQNPGTSDAEVVFTFLRAAGPPLTRAYTVPAESRVTVWLNHDVPELKDAEVAAIMASSVPIVAERAMYGRPGASPGRGFDAGLAGAGTTHPSPTWFFAEGATGEFFDMFLLLANPSAADADVEATFTLEDGVSVTHRLIVPAMSRRTVWVDTLESSPGGVGALANAGAIATRINVLNGIAIVAERSMWWPGPTPATWLAAHCGVGADRPARRWETPLGLVRRGVADDGDAETFLLIQNPAASPQQVMVRLRFSDGRTTPGLPLSVGAGARRTINIRESFASEFDADGPIPSRWLAASVEGAEPIVVEVAVYVDAPGVRWAFGASAPATPLP